MRGSVREVTYREFKDRLSEKAMSKRIPLFCTLEITMRCNMRCIHCYVPLEQRANKADITEELSYQEVCDILDEIAEAGCLGIKFTGGEPLIRPDFLDIYKYAKSKGFLVVVYTNGTLVDSTAITLFKEALPELVEMSLYGATRETYEGITNCPGSFDRCIYGIRLLHEAGIRLLLKTPIFSHNAHEVPSLIKYANSLGVNIICDPGIVPRLDSDTKPCSLNITPEEAAKFRAQTLRDVGGWEKFVMDGRSAYSEDLFTCTAGKIAFHVGADGTLHPCILYRTPGYKLGENAFVDGWNGFIKDITSKKLDRNHKCVQCSLRHICDNCPGKALLELHDETAIVDFYCQTTQQLSVELGLSSLNNAKEEVR